MLVMWFVSGIYNVLDKLASEMNLFDLFQLVTSRLLLTLLGPFILRRSNNSDILQIGY